MPKKDPQTGMWDRTIEDAELENALDEMQESEEAHQTYGKARARMLARVRFHELRDGERVRCGEFVIEGKARNGGGFEVPAWSSITAKVVREGGTEA